MTDLEEFDRNRKLNDDRLKDTFGMLEGHYRDLREQDEPHPHEAEIRSYQILAALGNPGVLRKVLAYQRPFAILRLSLLPIDLLRSSRSHYAKCSQDFLLRW
jgi:hypothetical protein